MSFYRQLNYILIITIFLFFSGCAYLSPQGRSFKRAERALSQGDYDIAVKECIESLKKNHSYQPSINLLKEIFPIAIGIHHKIIEVAINSEDPLKWDVVVFELDKLITMVDNLESLEMNQIEVWKYSANTRDYASELIAAKNNAADSHYQIGLKQMKIGDRKHMKIAASEFKTALMFSKNYKDSQTLYKKCRESASIRLAILPFENKSGMKKYGGIGNTLHNDVISKLLKNISLMEFIDIISRDQLDLIIEEQKLSHSGLIDPSNTIELGKIAGIHMLIVGEVTQILTPKTKKSTNRIRENKRIILRTESYQDSDGKTKKRNIYGNVKATVKIHSKITEATIIAGYQIIDIETAKILHSENLTGTSQYEYEWATYSGDKRALSFYQKSLIDKNYEAPPANEQMVLQALENLIGQISFAIRSALE